MSNKEVSKMKRITKPLTNFLNKYENGYQSFDI